MEIYKEDIRDLLKHKSTKKLKLKEDPTSGVFVEDLSSQIVKDVEQINELISSGAKQRATAATNMNAVSSIMTIIG